MYGMYYVIYVRDVLCDICTGCGYECACVHVVCMCVYLYMCVCMKVIPYVKLPQILQISSSQRLGLVQGAFYAATSQSQHHQSV